MKKTNSRGRPKKDPEPRKKQILDTAIKLFAKNGYNSTDMQQIADRLGIAKGTIYIYYKNKKELFSAAVENSIEQLTIKINMEVEKVPDPADKIRAIINAHFIFFNEDKYLAEILVRERGEFHTQAEKTYSKAFKANAHRIKAILTNGIKQNVFRKINVEKTTAVLANLLLGTIYTARFTGSISILGKAGPEITSDFFLYGIMKEEIKQN